MFLPYRVVSDGIIYRCNYALKCVKVDVILWKTEMMCTRIAKGDVIEHLLLSFHEVIGARCEMLSYMF